MPRPSRPSALPPEWCSFCKKNADEVGRLVEVPDGMKICDQCLSLANASGAPPPPPPND